jgi:hypothetical protein
VIREILDVLNQEDSPLLQWMVPRPAAEEDWYNWNIENWGTKWDVCDVYFENPADEDSIEFSFCSAWGPPDLAFETWAIRDGRVQFTLEYWEPGCGFVGSVNYDGEYIDREYAEANNNPERYKEIASEVWGYEEYEEPEPLTEWYKDGVEAKGLA